MTHETHEKSGTIQEGEQDPRTRNSSRKPATKVARKNTSLRKNTAFAEENRKEWHMKQMENQAQAKWANKAQEPKL